MDGGSLALKARACAGGSSARPAQAHARPPPPQPQRDSHSLTEAVPVAPGPAAGTTSPSPSVPMDRYVVKRPAEEEAGGGGKRPRAEAADPERAPWQEIRAEGLSCDYRLLFGRAEADELFRQLEEEVQYFEGTGPPPRRALPCPAGPGPTPVAWAELPGAGRLLQAPGVPIAQPGEAWSCPVQVPSGPSHVVMFPRNRGGPGRVAGVGWT